MLKKIFFKFLHKKDREKLIVCKKVEKNFFPEK